MMRLYAAIFEEIIHKVKANLQGALSSRFWFRWSKVKVLAVLDR